MKPLTFIAFLALLGNIWLANTSASAQDASAEPGPVATPGAEAAPLISPEAQAEKTVREVADKVDQDVRAQEASEGLLKQIYLLAEQMESTKFHWVAFALMVSGVVSFALQLTLGKLFVLARMSISLTEILSDVQGLAISLVGLVLTTQAAAQNSMFTKSPAAVLSATAVGVAIGYMFYRWGKTQELAAVDGRKVLTKVVVDPVKK